MTLKQIALKGLCRVAIISWLLGGNGLAVVWADSKATYDPIERVVDLPVVHVGTDQYQVKMQRDDTDPAVFQFTVSDLVLRSKLTFSDSDRPGFREQRTLSGLLAEIPAQQITVLDPVENRLKTLKAIPTRSVFDAVYGREWRDREEIALIAADGYRAALPVERFVEYDSYIAYEDVNREQFVLVKAADGAYVELGPFWLIWDNQSHPELQASVSYGWSWQLVEFTLTRFDDLFANSAPPAGSSAEVTRGFNRAREFCLSCHQVNGDGGEIAPELVQTRAVSRFGDARVRELILDIDATLAAYPNATGMVLRDELPDREQIADDIIAYLRAMEAAR
jgi:mono/diheme cytochrome c family protein